MQAIKQGLGLTIPATDLDHFEVDVPGQTWDVWYNGYAEMYCCRKNGGYDDTEYRFDTIQQAINYIHRNTEHNVDTSGYFWDRARVNEDGSVYLGYAKLQSHCDATIRYMADVRAERKHGINTYAELVCHSPRRNWYTFRFITVPHIPVGYGTFDAHNNAWID